MILLFATHRTHPPEPGGGAQQSLHALVEGLQARGHACEVVATLASGRPRLAVFRAARRLSGRRLSAWRDTRNGYAVTRTWDLLLPHVVARRVEARRPDAVVVDLGVPDTVVQQLLARGLAVVLRAVDVNFPPAPPPAHPRLSAFANSRFVADRYRAWAGADPAVLHPIVHPERYALPSRTPRFLTLVNPRPLKGLELTLELARRLPGRAFLLAESWPLPREARRQLQARVAQLPNVTLRAYTPDARAIYASTALLLVPSVVEEAFGRVVLEAQAAGIPVVASRTGGLPEAVGDGGVLVEPSAGAAAWADAVESILGEPARAALMEARARANARRDAFRADCILDRFEELSALRQQLRPE